MNAGHATTHGQIQASKYCGSCDQEYNGFEAFIPGFYSGPLILASRKWHGMTHLVKISVA